MSDQSLEAEDGRWEAHEEDHEGSGAAKLGRLLGLDGEEVHKDACHDERESLDSAAPEPGGVKRQRGTDWNGERRVRAHRVIRLPMRSRVKTQMRLSTRRTFS